MRRLVFIIGVMLLLLLPASQCFAKPPDLGIRMGAFMVYPEMSTAMRYSDNIYAVKKDKESGWIATLSPRVMAESIWSFHELNMDAGINKAFYPGNSDENFLDAHIMANGRLNITPESYIQAIVKYARKHEGRGSPDSQKAWKEPAGYDELSAGGLVQQGIGRFSLRVGGKAVGYQWGNMDLIDGSRQNLRNTRDRIEYADYARLRYAWMPEVNPFIETRFNYVRYDKKDLAQRDSDGYGIAAGTEIYMGGVTTGEVYGGYMSQDYDDEERKDISDPWYGLSLSWEATRLTSLEVGLERSVKETTIIGASGISATDVDFTVKHKLLRNLSIGLGLSYTNDDYQGVDITERYYNASPSVSYSLNPNLSIGLSYAYTKRESSSDGSIRDYAINRLSFSVTGRL